MKKSVIYLLILASLFALITGCDNEHGNTVSSSDDGRYYIRYESSDGGVAYCLDLSDGRIIVACPDPLCSHTPDRENCPFSDGSAYETAVSGRYIYYLCIGKKAGDTALIFRYDLVDNTTRQIYRYEVNPVHTIEEEFWFLAGDGKLLFSSPEVKYENGMLVISSERRLMIYDPNSDKVDVFGKYEDHLMLRFYSNGYLVFDSPELGRQCRTSGGFENAEPIDPPEGERFGGYDYFIDVEPGVMAKTYYPHGIYLYEENRRVKMPDLGENTVIYTPRRSGNDVYYQISAWKAEPGADGEYEMTLFITNENDETEKYVIKSRYRFRLEKAYGNCIICDIESAVINGETVSVSDISEKLIWIDLDTGNAKLYDPDLSWSEAKVGEITVNVTKTGL